MTQYTKPSVLPAWAETGDKTQPTNGEIQTGWPVSQIPPSRQRFNWILNYVANAVRYLLQLGIPAWDAAEDYPVRAKVERSGNTYVALIGTGNVNKDPVSEPTYWELWAFTASTLMAKTDSYLSKSVAGNQDVTLTAAEALNGILNFTGALTGNINVIVPTASRRWEISNSTSGAFTLTVKTSGGTGYTLAQGAKAPIHCDAVNVYRSDTVALDQSAGDARYAALAGLNTQVFSVAAATADAHAVNRLFGDGRFAAIAGSTAQAFAGSRFMSGSGAQSVNTSGVPVTLFTLSAPGRYDVFAYISASNYAAYATVVNDGFVSGGFGANGATNPAVLVLSLSGNNVQATQTSGGNNATIHYSYQKTTQ